MDLVHQFTIPAPPDQAWAALTDIPSMAACLPGAALDDGAADPYTGAVTVKVGAMTIRFRGEAEVASLDNSNRQMTLDLRGKDVRGASSAAATITMRAAPDGPDRTGVHVTTSLELKGKVAQFGRGVLQDVSNAILQKFVQNLEAQLAGSGAGADVGAPGADPLRAGSETGRPDGSATPEFASRGSGSLGSAAQPRAASTDDDVLDLGGAAVPVLMRRYATPLLAGAALVTAMVALARTFRRREPSCRPAQP